MHYLLLALLLFLNGDSHARAKEPMGVINTTMYCTGRVTTSGVPVQPGQVALSWDIKRQYRLEFGDLIYIDDEGEPYVFTDTMPRRWKRHGDIYLRNCKEAKFHGVKKRRAWFVRQGKKGAK
jgi:3D (Asp-Asp-Asp) domain-containing protein